MFIEIRKRGKKKKYYLIHSYRLGNKVKRISRYLGTNLTEKQLLKLKKTAENIILEQIKKDPLNFELAKDEISYYRQIDKKIEISHLQRLNLKQFTENFTYNTNAIEGSTVTFSEAKNLIEKKEPPKNNDEIETINVSKAIEYIKKTKKTISVELIKKLHFLCFNRTKPFAGKFRKVEVVIRDIKGNIIHHGAPASKINKLLKDLTEWYKKHEKKYPPLLLAALIHNQFEIIHPFQDGNGRVGRLLLNYILLKKEYPPININLKDRRKYYLCLKAFDDKTDIKPTVKFLINQYNKQYNK